MSRLQLPLRDQLRDPAAEDALQRIWSAVDARSGGSRPGARRRREPMLVVAAAALALAGGAAALVLSSSRDRGPLRLADGRPMVSVEAPAGGTLLSTSDGSSILLAAGARLTPLESTGTLFLAILERGRATFEVRPGGPRRWQIECGLATVEVVGTRFSCDRSPGRLEVGVQRGVVLVRGERVADRVRRLVAGQSLAVVDPPSSQESQEPQGLQDLQNLQKLADRRVAPDGSPPPPVPVAAAASPAISSWRDLARSGRHREAFATLGRDGVRRETRQLGVADLLALADVARLSGHPAEAVAPLERILREFRADAQSSLAAFTLGRIELDALSRPRRAARALNRALTLGIPQSLKEDVRARLVEAYLRMDDRAAARSALEAYEAEFPGGRYKSVLESRLRGNP